MPSYGSLSTRTLTHTHTHTHTSHFHVLFHALLKFNKAVSHDINSMAVRNCNPHVTHTRGYIQMWVHTCPTCAHTNTHKWKHTSRAVSVSTWSVKTQEHADFDPEKLLSLCFIRAHFLWEMTSVNLSHPSVLLLSLSIGNTCAMFNLFNSMFTQTFFH